MRLVHVRVISLWLSAQCLFAISIFSRMDATFQPWRSKLAWIKGINCRILADAALLLTSRHQFSPSIGPALTAGRKPTGISASIAFSRALDSLTNCVSRAREGDSPTAWCSVTAD